MCGEKLCCHCKITPLLGSPPRVRGKVDFYYFYTPDRRITPACAGKREQRGSNSQWLKDHPRVCGEKVLLRLKHSRKLGSPPRVRGKVPSRRSTETKPRITPACAGKSPAAAAIRCSPRDHPRVCGEKCKGVRRASGHLGSPPRVRGKGDVTISDKTVQGITPACAGKSEELWFILHNQWDHPRVCGEKFPFFPIRLHRSGSPPRVRGKVGLLYNHNQTFGITPACAGKSHPPGIHPRPVSDHPRVCGEKELSGWDPFEERGSPPRVRGKD